MSIYDDMKKWADDIDASVTRQLGIFGYADNAPLLIAESIGDAAERMKLPENVSKLVNKLREHVEVRGGPTIENGIWVHVLSAADTIEALQARVTELESLNAELNDMLVQQDKTIEAALEENKKLREIVDAAFVWKTEYEKPDDEKSFALRARLNLWALLVKTDALTGDKP